MLHVVIYNLSSSIFTFDPSRRIDRNRKVYCASCSRHTADKNSMHLKVALSTMTVHPSAVAAAFISTSIISLAPNILLFLFPNYGSSGHLSESGSSILSLGQSLAVGGLLGDVFLHTLPDCFAEESHDHNDMHHHNDAHDEHHHHHHNYIGLRVILGFSLFMILDVFVRSIEDKSDGHSHGHGHHSYASSRKGASTSKDWPLIILSSSVLLNLLGDALHNFTDGLAIGATYSITKIPHNSNLSNMALAFSLLKSRGGLASISVFLHEIPHELGDFATLVRAGLSRNIAIGLQFLTAIAALMGTAVGLFAGEIIEGLGHDLLLPFCAGGFIYLSSVTILPDVLETEVGLIMRILQVGSFLLGVGFMYAVAELEEMEASIGGHSHSEL